MEHTWMPHGAESTNQSMEAAVILPPHRRTPLAKYQQPTDFARQVFESLPLAQASLALFAYGVPTPFLADLFQRHRGRCYEDVVTDSRSPSPTSAPRRGRSRSGTSSTCSCSRGGSVPSGRCSLPLNCPDLPRIVGGVRAVANDRWRKSCHKRTGPKADGGRLNDALRWRSGQGKARGGFGWFRSSKGLLGISSSLIEAVATSPVCGY